ncbi:hypothetical protein [Maridesulfovibrio frigidus]|uniref:hypothetical protein n=1 Tax=Maridesulfovibrio frigidus TaxID=340956 RepID=UPI0004E22C43|nr:hypothetical protein [Maridesulfovibrio frigidus]
MKKTSCSATLLIILALFISGCGKSTSNSNDSYNPSMQQSDYGNSFTEVSDKTEAFYSGYFQVVGSGSGGSKSTALNAARSDAKARLSDIIQGLEYERNSLIRSGQIANNAIHLGASSLANSAATCGEHYNPNTQDAEVCLKLNLRTGRLQDVVEDLVIR